ncbi:MAG: hypothetical protein PHW92_10390 [Lutibacter sp.]|nr:hypothetical protein [Lutibacter sp.]
MLNFLTARNWVRKEVKQRNDVYIPPVDLNFSSTYKIYIPNSIDKPDFENTALKSLDILASIYSSDLDELISVIIEDRQILEFHIEDDSIKDGRPSIIKFDNLLGKVKDVLQDNATFVITKKHHFHENIEETERYLNLCNFFKNTSGSLITKIQLPNNEDIKERTIFDQPIKGADINKSLLNVFDFVNTELLTTNFVYPDEEFILDNKERISINVINKIKDFYKGTSLSDIDISLKSVGNPLTTTIKELNNEKINNLTQFTKVVREKLNEIHEYDVYGKIIQLASKDVESDQNTIKVEAEIKKVKSTITVKLSPADYQSAIIAHSKNKTVTFNAVLEKEKTQYKVVELRTFKVLS